MQSIRIELNKETKNAQLAELKAYLSQVQISKIIIVKPSFVARLFGHKTSIEIITE